MTINEVRVGNYVMHDGTIGKISGFEGQIVIFSISDGRFTTKVHIRDCQPVQITPDVLEAVGTKFRDGYLLTPPNPDSVTASVFVLVYDSTQLKLFVNWNYVGIMSISRLHRLQNIVHSLSGIELEYKTERV